MSVNFYKHRDEMVSAWKEVMNEHSPTNWALFGYERQTNDLTLVAKGNEGLAELFDEFNCSKILYAFCKVSDPNTDLIKYVLINWQGEGAPLQRKGICINHFRDINDFFKGAHLTINARTEDDVEPQNILSKVSKVSTKVNLKDRIEITENIAPVGTNYKRVQPQREISQTEREKFWQKEQEDERKRVADEQKKANETRTKLEREREERELKETKQRDAAVREKEQNISKVKEAEQIAAKNELNKELSSHDNRIDDEERRKRSEQMRKERAEEAKSVISQNSIRSARALFEQNSSAGQLNSVKTAQQSKVTAVREKTVETKVVPTSFIVANDNRNADNISNFANNEQKVIETEPIRTEPIKTEPVKTEPVKTEPEVKESEDNQVLYTRNLLQEMYIETQPLEDIAEEQTWDDANNDKVQYTVDDTYDNTPNLAAEATSESSVGLRARALFDYQAADETEISFDPDELITHIEQIDEGWWQGMAPDGSYGLFPANYVELID